MTNAIVVTTTTSSKDEARSIAEAVLTERLAACVQMHPVTSHFHWNGALHSEDEIMLTFKSRLDLYSKLEAAIVKHHSYEVPEIVATPIEMGHPAYLDWIDTETGAAG